MKTKLSTLYSSLLSLYSISLDSFLFKVHRHYFQGNETIGIPSNTLSFEEYFDIYLSLENNKPEKVIALISAVAGESVPHDYTDEINAVKLVHTNEKENSVPWFLHYFSEYKRILRLENNTMPTVWHHLTYNLSEIEHLFDKRYNGLGDSTMNEIDPPETEKPSIDDFFPLSLWWIL